MFRAIVIVFALNSASTALAGAWLRDKGETLVIAHQESYQIDRYKDQYSKIYVEHGLSPRFTLVAEVSRSEEFDRQQALLLLRTPLLDNARGHKISLEVGGGIIQNGNITDQLTRGTLAWGKGLETRFGTGWANAEVTVEQQTFATSFKADLTLGFDIRRDTKLILQLQNGITAKQEAYVRFTPSITYEIRPGTFLELGLRRGLSGEDSQGLKIGTWLQF